MIPKIIHYVWVGDKEEPEDVKKCIDSWKKFAPDYKIIRHGNEILDKVSNSYVSQALYCKKYAFVSDYLRLYVLEKFGGVYLDTDVELTAPINRFLKNDFFIGYEIYNGKINIMTGMIGCVKHHKFIKDLLREYDRLNFIKPDGTLNELPNPQRFSKYFDMRFDGVGADTGKISKSIGNNAKIYPYWYFCTPVKGKPSYSIHHFAGSWLQDVYRESDKLSINFKKTKLALVPYWKSAKNSRNIILEQDEKALIKISWLNHHRIYALVYGPKIKKTNLPKVSVLMPAYNAEKYVGEAIESILNQTFVDFEFVIINDGSTDNTAKIINKYAKQDKRIRFINNKKNQGLISVLNEGLDICCGEYIARMDSDDISLPERFAKQIEYMDRHPECGILGTAAQNFGKDDHIYYSPKHVDAIQLLRNSGFYHSSVMMRKMLLDKYKLRYRTESYCFLVEDVDLWIRCLGITKMSNLQEVLFKCRIHNSSVSMSNHVLQEYNKSIIRRPLLDMVLGPKKYLVTLFKMPLLKIKYKSTGYIKVYLFNFIPILKIKNNCVYLFHFIKIFNIRHNCKYCV